MTDLKTPSKVEQDVFHEDRIAGEKLRKALGVVDALLIELTDRGLIVEIEIYTDTLYTREMRAVNYPRVTYRILKPVPDL